VLFGKYTKNEETEKPLVTKETDNSRFYRFDLFQERFSDVNIFPIIEKYSVLAENNDMSLATLAQAFCKTRWYIPSTIIGD